MFDPLLVVVVATVSGAILNTIRGYLGSNTGIYDIKKLGFNYYMDEISAGIGIEQLKKLDQMVEVRRKNADLFVNLFGSDDRFIIQKENGKSSWFSFTMILHPDLKISRNDINQGLRDANIEFRIITGGNFLRHDVIKYFDHECVGEIKNADIAHDRGFFVGNFPRDITREIEYLHEVLNKLLS